MSTDTVTAVSHRSAAPSMAPIVIVAAVIAVVVTLILWLPLGWPAVLVGVVCGAAGAWLLHRWATSAVREIAGGEAADEDRHARLFNVVDGLSLTAGIQPPELRVRDEHTVNAAVVGHTTDDAMVVVTQGLLDTLDRIELEGVVAYLLVRLRSQDQAARSRSVATTGLPRLMGEKFGSTAGPGPNDPTVEQQIQFDIEAVGLTRFPPGLLSALEKAASAGTAVDGVGPVTSAFWFAPVDGTPAHLHTRVTALQEF